MFSYENCAMLRVYTAVKFPSCILNSFSCFFSQFKISFLLTCVYSCRESVYALKWREVFKQCLLVGLANSTLRSSLDILSNTMPMVIKDYATHWIFCEGPCDSNWLKPERVKGDLVWCIRFQLSGYLDKAYQRLLWQ